MEVRVARTDICSVEDCGNIAHGRGLCGKHLWRLRQNGHPLAVNTTYRRGPAPTTERNIPCGVEGCDGNSHYSAKGAKGYCHRHYRRLATHGSPTAGGTFVGDPMRWIETHAAHSGDECLIWPFGRNAYGRGVVQHEGKIVQVSRLMCTAAHGQPPSDNYEAAHNCGKGHEGCVHPGHLEWKTKEQNEADKIAHGTLVHGERSHLAKLTDEQVRHIRILLQTESPTSIAKRYGLVRETIRAIAVGRSWKWVE